MLINVLSNIWFYPINNNQYVDQSLQNIKKLQMIYGFTKIINLDKEFKFWINRSNNFIPEIQNNITKKDLFLLEKKLKYLSKIIVNSNLEANEIILFISINSIECMLLLHLYLFIKFTNSNIESKEILIKLIDIIKVNYNILNITLSDDMKSILF